MTPFIQHSRNDKIIVEMENTLVVARGKGGGVGRKVGMALRGFHEIFVVAEMYCILMEIVLACLGSCNKIPQTGQTKNNRNLFLTGLEARWSRSRC